MATSQGLFHGRGIKNQSEIEILDPLYQPSRYGDLIGPLLEMARGLTGLA
jgi:hypothetical protein